MARIKLCDGRRALYQWDTGVQVELCGCEVVTECHFPSASGGLILRDVVDGVCDVPDASLQQAGVLTVYAFSRSPMGGLTRHEFRLYVEPRPKPADYINPPDEKEFIDLLYERLKDEIVGPAGPQGERGETGETGQRGSKVLKIDTFYFFGYTDGINGIPTKYKIDLDHLRESAGEGGVYAGDVVLYGTNFAYVVYVDDKYAYMSELVSIKGKDLAIDNVKESTEDGGVNYVNFSDGNQLRVLNGRQGSQGPAGPQGERGPAGEAGPTGKTGVGISSLSQTTTSTADDGVNVWTATLTDGSKKTFTVRNGSKGSQGDPGPKGDPGERGEAGPAGPAGEPGKDGASVTIESITESTEDGGANVVTFSDGKQLRVKNGSKGSPGEGGGSASKYAQPDWGDEHVENYVYLPETELAVQEEIGGALVMSEVSLTAATPYTVTYNGVEYTCTTIENPDGSGALFLGNAGALMEGLPVTEDPFTIMTIPAGDSVNWMGAGAMVVPLDGSASFTLSIVGEKENIYSIPKKYLEAASPALFVPVDLMNLVVGVDYDTIIEAIEAGAVVYLKDATSMEIVPLTAATDAFVYFSKVYTIDGETITVNTVTINSDNTVVHKTATVNEV